MKLKKLVAVLSAAAVAVSAFVLPVGAETAVIDGELDTATGLVYRDITLEDGTTGWEVSLNPDYHYVYKSEIVIPESWGEGEKNKKVISIDDEILFRPETTTSISIPASVVQIINYYGTYYQDPILTEIKVADGNKNFCVEDSVLYNKDKTEIICYPANKSGTSFTIPSSVKTIGWQAFYATKNLRSVTIPDGITSVSIFAFMRSGVETLYLPASVTDVRNNGENNPIKTFIVDANNTALCVEDDVLYNKDKTKLICYPANKSGETFTVPNTVTSIAENAFAGSKNLKSVTISEGVTSVDLTDIFVDSVLESLFLPASVTEFEGHGCSLVFELKSVTIDENNPALCSENGVVFNKNKTELLLYPNLREGEIYDIPETVEKLHENAFFNSSNLKEINIPISVKEIDDDNFTDSRPKVFNYAGTIEQWNAITKNGDNLGIEKFGVCCSDGVIEGKDTRPLPQAAERIENGNGTTTFIPAVESRSMYTEEQMKDVKAIKVDAPSDAFENDVKMQVEPDYIRGNAFAVDIKFVKPNGEKVQPSKAVTVKIPIPAYLSGAKNLNLYHRDENNGKYTKVDYTIETFDGREYVVFKAASFSVYEITTEEKTLNLSDSSNDPSSVPTYGPFEHNKYTGESNRVTISIDSTPANTTTEAAPADTTAAANTTATEASNNGGDRDTNQPTGAAIAVVPAILAIAGVVLSKKRK